MYTALLAPVAVGLAGIAVDVGVWYAEARRAQSAADSAALAGALEILRSDSDPVKIDAAVDSDLLAYGFSTGNGDSITVNYPPTSGLQTGATDSVEVIIRRPAQMFFSSVLLDDAGNIAARAVAVADVNDTCVWSLNPTDPATLSVTGAAEVNLGCGVFVNSNNPSALSQSGSGCLTSTKIKVVGGYSGACVSPQPLVGATPIIDPLASLQAPPYDPSNCDFPQNFTINSGQSLTLTPGTYCGRIKVISDAFLHFEPGLYILDDAALEIGAQATVTGTDVSFYLTPNNNEAIVINAGANVTLSAPADGPLPGVLFYHDRDSLPGVTHKLAGGANMNLEGIIYFPSQNLQFAGGTSLNTSTSLLIANTVTFTGNTDIGDFENTPVLANPLLISATLVE